MLDLAQNSPSKVKVPTQTIKVEKKQNIYIYIVVVLRVGDAWLVGVGKGAPHGFR